MGASRKFWFTQQLFFCGAGKNLSSVFVWSGPGRISKTGIFVGAGGNSLKAVSLVELRKEFPKRVLPERASLCGAVDHSVRLEHVRFGGC